MIRVNVVAEGQSELCFAKKILNGYFGGSPIVDSRCVLTGKIPRTNYEYRGGLLNYQKTKNDIVRWIKEDTGAYVTTMFDFFRLPNDFPGYTQAMSCPDHRESVRILEEAMKADIASDGKLVNVGQRFIPYIQLHEFEALLFTDIHVLKEDYLEPDDQAKIDRLYEDTKEIPPEEIDHGEDTAPSKRLLRTVGYRKGEAASQLLEKIGIDAIREKCPNFSEWIATLQMLKEY